MSQTPDKLIVTISKTSDGMRDYIQIISSDQFSINVVLIADTITIKDGRPS